MNDQVRITSRYSGVLVVAVIVTELIVCGCLFAAFSRGYITLVDDDFLRSLVLVLSVYFAVVVTGGIDLHRRRTKDYEILLNVLKNTFYFAIASVLALHVGRFYVFRWYVYIAFLFCNFILSAGLRYTLRYFVKKYHQYPANRRRIILLGGTQSIMELYKELRDNKVMGYDVLGYFNDTESKDEKGMIYLGNIASVVGYLKAHPQVQEVYCGNTDEQSDTAINELIHYCELKFINFYSVPCVNKYTHRSVYLNVINTTPVIGFYQGPLNKDTNRMIKRAFDICFSLLFLVTLFPVIFIIVYVVTKLTMPGPVFFTQKRSGLNGKEFNVIKFRSMKVNKEADTAQATKDDPRKTTWGNILRKTNLDEMPQFINVLLGSMSVVGPRPHMINHTELYSQLVNHYMVRHCVKPGITGWSQVTGFRGETKELSQMEGRVKGDIWYMEHWSMWLDLFIILKTIYNAFVGDKNAY